jgi:hypothetical protein
MMRRSLETFPIFPYCAETFVTDVNVESRCADHLVKDPSGAAPLDVRLQDFSSCVGRLDEVLEIESLGTDLSGMRFLICERVDAKCSLGAHWDDIKLTGLLAGETFSLIAIAAAYHYPVAHLSKVGVLLHEIAHYDFLEHDIWFAALLNWQRLRCGLPLLSDLYDVRNEEEQQEFRPFAEHEVAEAALKMAHEIATMFCRVSSRKLVADALRQLQLESWALGDVEALRARALELSSMMA